MITVRRNYERGRTELGWLHSKHTFSFSDYYDPCYQGVSVLRVLNEDHVDPGGGFDTHEHQDMEIICYVLEGTMRYQDSLGNVQLIEAGDFQLISAGSGIAYSESNTSSGDPLKFIQVWIESHERGSAPSYQQQGFTRQYGAERIVSSDGSDGTLRIHQDMSMHRILLRHGSSLLIELPGNRTAYLHMVRGAVGVEGKSLNAGDGATISKINSLTIRSESGAEALLFDLP